MQMSCAPQGRYGDAPWWGQDLWGGNGEFSAALHRLSGTLSIIPGLLTHSFSAQVLTVLCNVAEKGPAYCQQLHQRAALPLLLGPLALPDPEVVGQCLELLHLLFLHCPQVGWGFTPLNPV